MNITSDVPSHLSQQLKKNIENSGLTTSASSQNWNPTFFERIVNRWFSLADYPIKWWWSINSWDHILSAGGCVLRSVVMINPKAKFNAAQCSWKYVVDCGAQLRKQESRLWWSLAIDIRFDFDCLHDLYLTSQVGVYEYKSVKWLMGSSLGSLAETSWKSYKSRPSRDVKRNLTQYSIYLVPVTLIS